MINYKLYNKAFKMALKVHFLENSEEIKSYAGALYSAMMWGRGIDEKNQVIQERDKSLK